MKKVTSEQSKSTHDSILDVDSAIDSEVKGSISPTEEIDDFIWSKKDQSKQRKKEK